MHRRTFIPDLETPPTSRPDLAEVFRGPADPEKRVEPVLVVFLGKVALSARAIETPNLGQKEPIIFGTVFDGFGVGKVPKTPKNSRIMTFRCHLGLDVPEWRIRFWLEVPKEPNKHQLTKAGPLT